VDIEEGLDPGAAEQRYDERGQGMVEYGLILVLIAVVVVLVLGILGHQVQNVFSNVSSALTH
jgi:pilus assembly protein Flp/PilA